MARLSYLEMAIGEVSDVLLAVWGEGQLSDAMLDSFLAFQKVYRGALRHGKWRDGDI